MRKRAQKRACTHARPRARKHVSALRMHALLNVHAFVRVCVRACVRAFVRGVCVCFRACLLLCTCVCTHTRTHVCACTHTRTQVQAAIVTDSTIKQIVQRVNSLNMFITAGHVCACATSSAAVLFYILALCLGVAQVFEPLDPLDVIGKLLADLVDRAAASAADDLVQTCIADDGSDDDVAKSSDTVEPTHTAAAAMAPTAADDGTHPPTPHAAVAIQAPCDADVTESCDDVTWDGAPGMQLRSMEHKGCAVAHKPQKLVQAVEIAQPAATAWNDGCGAVAQRYPWLEAAGWEEMLGWEDTMVDDEWCDIDSSESSAADSVLVSTHRPALSSGLSELTKGVLSKAAGLTWTGVSTGVSTLKGAAGAVPSMGRSVIGATASAAKMLQRAPVVWQGSTWARCVVGQTYIWQDGVLREVE